MWNIDWYHILTKCSLWWNISDYHRYSTVVSNDIGQVCMVRHCTETRGRHDANIVITQVVIMMTTCGDHGDDKFGIMVIFDFRYYSWSSEHQDYDCNTFTGGNRMKLPSWRWRRRGRSLREVFACSCFFATTDLSQIYNRETRRHGTPCTKTTDSYLFSFLYNDPRNIRRETTVGKFVPNNGRR